MALCQFILTLDTGKSPCFPLLSLLTFSSSPRSPVASVSCQCPFCSEMLWDGAGDTGMGNVALGKGRGPDCRFVLDAPIRMIFIFLSFCFLLYVSISSFTLHLYMSSCSCSCSSKLFHLSLQANFSRPHKHLSVILPSPLNFAFLLSFIFFPLS